MIQTIDLRGTRPTPAKLLAAVPRALTDVTSWMVGRIIQRIPVHNNAVVVVQIEEGGAGVDDEALLYHERTYRVPGATV